MPKAESTDNLLTRKLSASVTGERIFAGSKKTRKTDNSPVYLKKILSLSLVANGQLTGTQDMGGLVGSNFGTVQNSYATATFSSPGAGFNTVGGLVGLNSGTLKNS